MVLILASVLGFRPWSQAPRLDLRSGKNMVEHVLSSRPGERRLILIPEGFMLYGLGARSLGSIMYNIQKYMCVCVLRTSLPSDAIPLSEYLYHIERPPGGDINPRVSGTIMNPSRKFIYCGFPHY